VLFCSSQATATSATPTPPVFSDVWSATEAVEESFQPGKAVFQNYFDGANNRELMIQNHTEYDTMITDWSAGVEGKVYYIRTYGHPAVRHCEKWCTPTTPIACDSMDSLCQYDYNKSAAFVETATIDGQPTNLFKWHDNMGPFPMNKLYLYATQSAPYAPVQMIRDVHPFGKEIGNVTIDYTNFRPLQSIDPALFDLGPKPYICEGEDPDPSCPAGGADARVIVLDAAKRAGAQRFNP
jgi:hypothetical protein